MQIIRLLLMLLGFIASLNANLFAQQGVAINTDNSNPDVSAILDVKSTTKGVLVPRMTAAEKSAIPVPALSLLIFQTDGMAGFYYFNGTIWVPIGGASGLTLDGAYDFGGAGAGNTIIADAGAVTVAGEDGFVNTGTFGAGLPIGAVNGIPEGAGTRMFFNPNKAAFRAGYVDATQWDNANVGIYSTALGANTRASGIYSTALGSYTTASAIFSTALGATTIASGNFSTSLGYSTIASGYASTAMGNGPTASGWSSTAMGFYTIAAGETSTAMGLYAYAGGSSSTAMGHSTFAYSFGETTIGIHNTEYIPLNTSGYNAADRLFVIGNGIHTGARSDAMVVLKNGNTGLGTSTPTATLDVVGSFKLTNGSESAGRVLTSDAAGNATWTTPVAGGGGTLDAAYDFGGTGAGRTIVADAGAVAITGFDGFFNTGTAGFGIAIGAANGIPEGAGTRMFFNPRKAAFRAGYVDANQWNNVIVGDYSMAVGYNSIASGFASTAMGGFNTASGFYSTAMGASNTASGLLSTAMGNGTTASGSTSTAMGYGTTASGQNSTTMGNSTTASGENSVAMGFISNASGENSVAMGVQTTASASISTAMGWASTASAFASTAMGRVTTASGENSTAMGAQSIASGESTTAMGVNSTAHSFGETTIGTNNTTYVPLSTTSYNAADRLFVIGNGSSAGARSNAMVVLKNGNTGLGTSTPTARLDVVGSFKLTNGTQAVGRVLTSDASGNATWAAPAASGVTLDGAYDFGGAGAGRTIVADAGAVTVAGVDGFLNTGTLGSGLVIGAANGIPEGAGTRMFFNPRKAAFRAGYVDATQWDNANVGSQSVAMGLGTTASGSASAAMGYLTTSSGDNSFSVGYQGIASGASSTVMGFNSTAPSFAETSIGTYNTTYTPLSTTAYNSADRLFVIGNGAFPAARSNAMVVLKNGKTGIGNYVAATPDPTSNLHVVGSIAGTLTTTAANITLTDAHYTVIITGGTPVITLPTAASALGRIYNIINHTAAARTVQVSAGVGYTNLAGTANVTTVALQNSILIQSNGTTWYQIK